MPKKRFVIRDKQSGTYYAGTTAIGPCFGASKADAMRFTLKSDAQNVMASHAIAFVMAEIETT